MPQIKLGFDRVPVPTTTRLEELKNFPTGETLRDRTGNILYTEVDAPLRERAKTKNATSVYFNNDTDAPLKIEEQFPDTSEVSSTLLGIDRAETQLSLFSDVSSYGLNEEEFEYFLFVEYPIEIFGHAGLSYSTTFTDIHKMIFDNPAVLFGTVFVKCLQSNNPLLN